MAVLIPGKLLYLCQPRTGSMATCTALMQLPGAIEPRNHHISFAEVKEKHGYNGELILTTVRNHWDTTVSWWLLDARRLSLYNFCENYRHSHAMKNHKYWWLHEKMAQKILRYENLVQEINGILKALDLPSVNFVTVNATPEKRHWKYHMSEEAFERTKTYFWEEIQLYGYDQSYG